MASVPETEGRPLLLVDDDAPFRQRLSVLLSRKGFAVTSVGSLQEARVEAARLKPAHAVVDMRLEDGNGLDLGAELRAMMPWIAANKIVDKTKN